MNEDRPDTPQKIIIWARHRYILEQLEPFLKTFRLNDKTKVEIIRIDGKTALNERNNRTWSFQNVNKVRIALLSMGSCGTGITLTKAQSIVFTELDWDPSYLKQCEDRAHRIGQKSVLNIYYCISKDTYEELIW